MAELTEEERRFLERLLNSVDAQTLNFIALDAAYGEDWHDEHVEHLREIEQYLQSVQDIGELSNNYNAVAGIDSYIQNTQRLINLLEEAKESISSEGDSDTPAVLE